MASRCASRGLWANCHSGSDSELQTTSTCLIFVYPKYRMGHADTKNHCWFIWNAHFTGQPMFLVTKASSCSPHWCFLATRWRRPYSAVHSSVLDRCKKISSRVFQGVEWGGRALRESSTWTQSCGKITSISFFTYHGTVITPGKSRLARPISMMTMCVV